MNPDYPEGSMGYLLTQTREYVSGGFVLLNDAS